VGYLFFFNLGNGFHDGGVGLIILTSDDVLGANDGIDAGGAGNDGTQSRDVFRIGIVLAAGIEVTQDARSEDAQHVDLRVETGVTIRLFTKFSLLLGGEVTRIEAMFEGVAVSFRGCHR